MTRGPFARRLAASGAAAICALLLSGSPALAAGGNFTWNGDGAQSNWSFANNWTSNAAPSGSVGTLRFPALSSGCGTCYSGVNDITGLSVNGISIDDHTANGSYLIGGNSITLGSGGIRAATSNAGSGPTPSLLMPIVLGASQTWSIGVANTVTGLGQLSLNGAVTGSHALKLKFGHESFLNLENSVDVGPVTVSGGDSSLTGGNAIRNGAVALGNPGPSGVVGSLDASDGNPVTLLQAELIGFDGKVGPLTSLGGEVQVGEGGVYPAGGLTVNGGIGLDGASQIGFNIDGPHTTPHTDYGQLKAAGAVDLGSAGLSLYAASETASNHCQTLTPGATYTLVSTTGSVKGTFAGLSDGAKMAITQPLGCAAASAKLAYLAHSVTATVVDSSSSVPPPALGKKVDAAPVSGTIKVELPGTNTFVALKAGERIPVGTTVDARRGVVALTSATDRQGHTKVGDFYGGEFVIGARKVGQVEYTLLRLTGPKLTGCKARGASIARRRPHRLWGSSHGGYGTVGNYASATERGTKWLTQDSCAGTLVRVVHGVVAVRDFPHHKTIKLTAGHSFLAHPGKGG